MIESNENPINDASQKEKAKLRLVSRISRLIRRAGIDYEGWRYVSAQRVRKECSLQVPQRRGGVYQRFSPKRTFAGSMPS
jgi:hypothetical protein